MSRPSKLSASSPELVLRVLQSNVKPLSAYEILEKVKEFGIKSPPIVYRALDTLMKIGKVHKINELNTFIACDCEEDHQHADAEKDAAESSPIHLKRGTYQSEQQAEGGGIEQLITQRVVHARIPGETV